MNYTDVDWCNSVQHAITTSRKELLCNSNILPFVLHLLALRIYSSRVTFEFPEILLFRRTSCHTCTDQLVHGQCLIPAGKSTVKIARTVENLVTTLGTAQTQTLNTDMIYAGTTHCLTKKTV